MEVFHDTATETTECHLLYVGSHSDSCYPTQAKRTHYALTPAIQAGTRFTYPGGMKG